MDGFRHACSGQFSLARNAPPGIIARGMPWETKSQQRRALPGFKDLGNCLAQPSANAVFFSSNHQSHALGGFRDNCRIQMTDLNEHYKLGATVAGITELVVKAVVKTLRSVKK